MTEVKLEMLLCGNGVNFDQGDLALSGVFLISSTTSGVTTRTIVDTGHVGMRRNLLAALVRAKVDASRIDNVALTHAHWDHVQNVDLFPTSRLLISRAELQSIQRDTARDLVTPAWTRHLVEAGRVVAVDPGDDAIPGVEIVDAAGHTAGSLAFAMDTEEGRAVITGDALPWAEVARQRRSALVFWDLARSQATIDRLLEMADVLYPGHDRPFRLVDGEIVYERDLDVTIFGVSSADPGLHFAQPAILSTIDLTDGEPVGPRWTKEELWPR